MPHDHSLAGHPVLPEVSFSFEVTGVDGAWIVAHAVVRERLSAPFEAAVTVSAPPGTTPASLLGKGCALTLQRDTLTRDFAGVVTSVDDRGVDREGRVFEVGFAPSLALLGLSARYRVWQGADALRLVRDVLDAAKLYAGDHYDASLAAGADAPAPREYCVQVGETDLDFVRRLRAEEGVLFTFGGPDGATRSSSSTPAPRRAGPPCPPPRRGRSPSSAPAMEPPGTKASDDSTSSPR
ncbi:MAG: phage late control D family protein [Deltaproteobacteria bacterium]|nr:phage late control D family protein [Deltaproteobacteria bacterium]